MLRIKNTLIALISLGAFIALVAVAIPITSLGHAAGTDKDVNVVNTPNVNVVNSPTVQAQQNGVWNVGVTGTPTVHVANSTLGPILVRDVDRPTAQPFEQEIDVTLPNGQGGENAFLSVPLGKLLVIEQVSANGTAPSGQHLNFSILSRVLPDLTLRPHRLSSVQEIGSPETFFVQSQQVRIYADATVGVRIDRGSANTGTANATFVVSGYLVNK